jgi:hypothetical protein
MEEKDNKFNIQDWEDVEREEVDESIKLMDKPFDPTKINIDTKTPSLDTLIKRIKGETVAMNTEEYFQRKDDLWDVVKQSRLIESILIRFPLPAFFFDASDDNHWLIVDGLQRLSSIRNFCVTKTLKLTNLEFLTQLEGDGWDDLPEDLQRVIEESQAVIYKIMPGTPTDVKFNIFKRINTGGLVLEPQEIRHALFQGKPAEFVAKLAGTDEFLRATGGRIKTHRMLDRDFVTRFLCFYFFGHEKYQPDLDTFMSKAMAYIKAVEPAHLETVEADFKKAMNLSYKIFKEEAFRKIVLNKEYQRLPPINKALFDALTAQFAELNEDDVNSLANNGEEFKQLLKNELTKQDQFFVSVTSGTGDKSRVQYRHNKVKELINTCIR